MREHRRDGPPWREGSPWRDGSPWADRHRPDRHWVGGAVIAALLFHLLGARSQYTEGTVFHPWGPLTVLLLVAGPLALIARRKAPVAVLAVALAGSIGFATVAAPRWSYAVAPVIALFTVTTSGRRAAGVLTAGVGFASYVLVTTVFAGDLPVPPGDRPELRHYLVTAAALLLTAFIGVKAKAQSEHMAELMKVRAERARAREEQERRQASEERLRIARELHDVLGHHLSLINVQAGVGLHLMDNRPEQAREALAAIKTASSEALREVRAVLGVLRPEEEAAPRQPPLGLDRLAELTADAGLPVTTTTKGERRALPAEVDRAAYRIVQEALTNVRRHAPAGACAEVVAEYAPAELLLSVRNDAPGPARSEPGGSGVGAAGTGSGIAGMRARAESLGGTLTAGPLPAGGFGVDVTLPAPIEEPV